MGLPVSGPITITIAEMLGSPNADMAEKGAKHTKTNFMTFYESINTGLSS